MKITAKILSIPPYISTSWPQIHSLHTQEKMLHIRLTDGTTVSVPDLQIQHIEAIFAAHTAYAENSPSNNAVLQDPAPMQFLKNMSNSQIPSMPYGQNSEGIAAMHFNLENMESFGASLYHNAEQAHMPSLPPEILQKIAAITKIIAPGEIKNMPKPEPHCNCPHCQIARAIHSKDGKEETNPLVLAPIEEEEIVNEQDLTFQQWEISQTGDKLYSVANRLDLLEKYSVFLGQPVGCTCGVSGCEHILAVLKS